MRRKNTGLIRIVLEIIDNILTGYHNVLQSNIFEVNTMVLKSVKFDDDTVKNIEKVIAKLNEKTGVNIYDFSNIIRIAVNQYLNSEEIKEMLEQDRDLLYISETSLRKDWLLREEDKAWENL